jgi:CheY-like chemotaxis protein
VLFVDDESAVVRLAKRSLEVLGYQVTTFTRPEDALAAFMADPQAFDVVVSDVTMPGMTGDVLAAQLHERRPELPIILCTGYSARVGREQVSAMGVREIVQKPTMPAQLSAAIRRAMGGA